MISSTEATWSKSSLNTLHMAYNMLYYYWVYNQYGDIYLSQETMGFNTEY